LTQTDRSCGRCFFLGKGVVSGRTKEFYTSTTINPITNQPADDSKRGSSRGAATKAQFSAVRFSDGLFELVIVPL